VDLIDMPDDAGERLAGVGERQEVVKERAK